MKQASDADSSPGKRARRARPESFLSARGTLAIAHRGANGVRPENTLVAFEKAAALGADGIELDVRICADGVPVVIHDARVDRTTDGSGRVAEMTLKELKRLDAGAWFDPAFAGEGIPALGEVLEAWGDRLLLNIELKGEGVLTAGLARAVVELVEQHGVAERVLLSSFSPFVLRRAQALAPQIPTALLYSLDLLPRLAELLSPRSYSALHPHVASLSQRHLEWIRAQGYRVHVWTVDDPGKMEQLVEWGVNGIITNRPELLQSILRKG